MVKLHAAASKVRSVHREYVEQRPISESMSRLGFNCVTYKDSISSFCGEKRGISVAGDVIWLSSLLVCMNEATT